MATREALAIRREAAEARIVSALGSGIAGSPAPNRDPDVTRTEFMEWTADTLEGLHDELAEVVALTDAPEQQIAAAGKPKPRAPKPKAAA